MDPVAEYTSRWKHRKALARRYRLWDKRYSYLRLALALLTMLAGWLAFAWHLMHPGILAAPVTGFAALAVIQEGARRRWRRTQRAAEFYRQGLDRIEGKWAGRGWCGERYDNENHPYAVDLDLFGRGGLFELLCAARTTVGRRTLAQWLLEPADPVEVRARQEAVDELRSRLDLREELAVMGEEVRRSVRASALPRWGEAPPLLQSRAGRLAAAGAAAAVLATAAAAVTGTVPPSVFLAALGLAGGVGLLYRQRVRQAAAAVEQPSHELDVLARVLKRLESEPFGCVRLRRLQGDLRVDGTPPSRRIARLERLVELLDSRDHILVRIIGPPLLWTTQIAFAIEVWRAKTGPHLRKWLRAVGEFEALSSLAGYAFEHPGDPFPEFTAERGCFDGRGLGHPLLPEGQCVRNDLRLDAERQVLLVSGSNMSGKSTLLRTAGVNAVLAMTGAPVRASSLRLSPLRVGASIRVVDSLQGGTSRFYAEITRIRQIMDLAGGDGTVLFLLDEVLHGTNSHDRRAGAAAIIRKLVERGAIGLVTTHDLALAHLDDGLSPRVSNGHFRDHIEDGRMTFDYKLRPGLVEHSNAIELMRIVGLEV